MYTYTTSSVDILSQACCIQDVTRHKESCHSCVVLIDITVLLYINILFIS